MLVCPSCKAHAVEGVKFCRKCGVQMVPENAVAPEAIAKRQLFEARLKADPQNIALLKEFGDFLLSVGLTEDALVQLHKASEIDQGDEALFLKIAKAYRAVQKWDNAATQIWRALEVSPNKLVLYERLANVLLEGGRKEDAAQAFVKQAELTQDNLPILVRVRDLLCQTKKHENLADVCRKILEKEPRDLATWSIRADACLAANRKEDAVAAFESILELNPDEPRANLYVGIARHDAALYAETTTFPTAIALLDKAVSGKFKLSMLEQNLAPLYLVSAKLHSGSATLETQPLLKDINPSDFDQNQNELLAKCFLLFGDIEKKSRKIDEAIESYKRSLQLHDSLSSRKRLAEAYGEKGDKFRRRGKYILAQSEFEQGLFYVPDEPSLTAKRDAAISRQKRKNLVMNLIGAALFVIAGLSAAFWYYGQGAFLIATNPPGSLSLEKNGKIIASADNGMLETGFLRYGSYRLAIKKDGYEPVTRELKVGLGRKTEPVKIALKPIYGSLKVNSDPPGATVMVRNKYEEKSETTPCEIANLLALPTTITVSLPACTPFTTEKTIPAVQALDLGTIVFKGNLTLDSDPSGAQVLIDNKLRGETPLKIAGLLAKKTSVVVRKQNVGVFAQDVAIEPQKTTDLGKVILSNLGALKAKSTPSGAAVFLDGKRVGETPLVLNDVETGDHKARIEVADCTPYEKAFDIRAGNIIDLGKISFLGSVKLDSDPTGADVYVTGEMKGKTPIILKDLKARQTQIELRYPGKGSHSTTVAVRPDAVTDLGVLRLSSFSGKWIGKWTPVNGNATEIQLFIKQGTERKLLAGGFFENTVYQVFDGSFDGDTFVLNGISVVKFDGNWGNYTIDVFTGRISADYSSLSGDSHCEGRYTGTWSAKRIEDPDYAVFLNDDLRYFIRSDDCADDGRVYVNGGLIAHIPENRSSGWLDITPLLKSGENRVQYNHTKRYGDRWQMDFAFKRVRANGQEEILAEKKCDMRDNTNGLKYQKEMIIPYFDNATALAQWQKQTPPPSVTLPSGGSVDSKLTSVAATGADDFSQTYFAIIQQRIEANFQNPIDSSNITCAVQFPILRDGTINVNDIRVMRSTGNAAFDQYAVDAVKRTNNLPPLWDSYPKNDLTVTVTFNYRHRQ